MKKKFLALMLILSLLFCGCEVVYYPAETPTTPDFTEGETLTVHYIDVGQADSILLETEGKFMLIDGGNKEDGQLVISYLQQQGVEELEAVICTHAHEDHVGGLPSVLAVFPVKAVYAPTRTYSSKVFDSFLHYVDQQGLEVTIPAPGDKLALGGVDMTVVGPVKSYAETNDTSIVVLADYSETRFLFTGDMETPAENDMLDYWGDRINWNVDVLKAGHHGSDTSSGYRFVYEADPEYAIVSVGTGNTYGHPSESILSRYGDAGIPLFRTDELGHVIVTTDGQNIAVTWENQNAQPSEYASSQYIGNKNSKKVHTGDCSNLPGENNRVEFTSLNDAIAAGYTPCGTCMK